MQWFEPVSPSLLQVTTPGASSEIHIKWSQATGSDSGLGTTISFVTTGLLNNVHILEKKEDPLAARGETEGGNFAQISRRGALFDNP